MVSIKVKRLNKPSHSILTKYPSEETCQVGTGLLHPMLQLSAVWKMAKKGQLVIFLAAILVDSNHQYALEMNKS